MRGRGLVAAGLAAALLLLGCSTAAAGREIPAASVSAPAAPDQSAPSRITPSGTRPTSGYPTSAPSTRTTSSRPAAPAPRHFGTLKPGATLPSGRQCATWVRAQPTKENKGVNRSYNRTTGQRIDGSMLGSGTSLAARVDGQFTGSTEDILRWAACKWGIDEDIVKAQAAIESWWRQTTLGDFGTDANACPAGHGLGVDGQSGQCPQSYGILQDRYPYMKSAFPGSMRSTAMNADVTYAIWRNCFEGNETWLNTVERGTQYAPGDAWGCVGRWFSGRWHTTASEQYIGRVKDYLRQRIWETPNFQQP
jgi:hypothetical protein